MAIISPDPSSVKVAFARTSMTPDAAAAAALCNENSAVGSIQMIRPSFATDEMKEGAIDGGSSTSHTPTPHHALWAPIRIKSKLSDSKPP